MSSSRTGVRLWPLAGAALCLLGAALMIPRIDPGAAAMNLQGSAGRPAKAVEQDFTEVSALLEAGERSRVLMMLNERVRDNRDPGVALLLIGELNYSEGAYSGAVEFYRKALAVAPSLADKHGPFESDRVLTERVAELRERGWPGKGEGETRTLNLLARKLAGGCR